MQKTEDINITPWNVEQNQLKKKKIKKNYNSSLTKLYNQQEDQVQYFPKNTIQNKEIHSPEITQIKQGKSLHLFNNQNQSLKKFTSSLILHKYLNNRLNLNQDQFNQHSSEEDLYNKKIEFTSRQIQKLKDMKFSDQFIIKQNKSKHKSHYSNNFQQNQNPKNVIKNLCENEKSCQKYLHHNQLTKIKLQSKFMTLNLKNDQSHSLLFSFINKKYKKQNEKKVKFKLLSPYFTTKQQKNSNNNRNTINQQFANSFYKREEKNKIDQISLLAKDKSIFQNQKENEKENLKTNHTRQTRYLLNEIHQYNLFNTKNHLNKHAISQIYQKKLISFRNTTIKISPLNNN